VFSILLVAASQAQADFEADLLQKFQQQHQKSAFDARTEIQKLLQRAAALNAEPEKALEILRRGKEHLDAADKLPRAEKESLARRLDDMLREVKERVRAQEAVAKEEAAKGSALIAEFEAKLDAKKDKKLAVSPIFFTPQFTPVPSQANVQVTPVVSPNRMWVRVGVSGTFTFPSANAPLVPVQIVTPTILQGPGRGFTVVPFYGVRQTFLPSPALTQLSINTTASAPTGGSVVLGGYSSFMESRTESGVPVLSQIPYANRLFRNVAYGAQGNSVQVNVAPRVIILAEEDQRLLGK